MKLKIGLLLLFLSFMTCGAQTLTVASYNLRNANPKDEAQGDGWKQRYPVIADLIHFRDFDIFGAQEVLHDQLTDMLAALPDYDYIGVGRNDGKVSILPYSIRENDSNCSIQDTFGWLKIPQSR